MGSQEALTSDDIPQANSIDRVAEAVRVIAVKGTLKGSARSGLLGRGSMMPLSLYKAAWLSKIVKPRERWATLAQVALIAWSIAPACLAQALQYDAFCDRDGNITSEQQQRAAFTMVRDAGQLEAVYADAAAGNARAQRVWQALEANFEGAGVGAAERATRPGCLVPGYRELSQSCIPDWSFLDFLRKDKPGGTRLRSVIFSAFAARALERGLENKLILSAVNGLVAVGVAAAVLREAEVAAATDKGLGTNPFQGKTPQEIDKMLRDKGFEPRGPDPVGGRGGYVDPKTGRSYHIDPGGQYKAGTEHPHVDVNRPPASDLPKRKYPLGEKLNDHE